MVHPSASLYSLPLHFRDFQAHSSVDSFPLTPNTATTPFSIFYNALFPEATPEILTKIITVTLLNQRAYVFLAEHLLQFDLGQYLLDTSGYSLNTWPFHTNHILSSASASMHSYVNNYRRNVRSNST